MTFNHAQSARLGQRVPPETSSVQVIATLADLPEVAYEGQVIYVQDIDVFQVYDGAWQTPSTLQAGVKTFVRPDAPTNPTDDISTGDMWINSITREFMVWDGAMWGPVSASGEVNANTVTVIQGASLGGTTEIVRAVDGSAGVLRLTAYTTAPKSAPLAIAGYETQQLEGSTLWHRNDGCALVNGMLYTYNRVNGWIEEYDLTPVVPGENNTLNHWVTAEPVMAMCPYGTPGSETQILVLTYSLNHHVYSSAWTLWTVDVTTPSAAPVMVGYVPAMPGTKFPGMFWDNAATSTVGKVCIAQADPGNGGKIKLTRYELPTGTQPLALLNRSSVSSNIAYDVDLAGLWYGSADFPSTPGTSNRFVMTSKVQHDFRPMTPTGTFQTFEYWHPGVSEKVGFYYQDNLFHSVDVVGAIRTYTQMITWTTTVDADPNKTKYVANTLANATLETDASPVSSVDVPKRAALFVTTSAINSAGTNAPDRVRIYVGTSSTSLWKQADPSVGSRSAVYTSLATSGSHPPANGFIAAGGTVQRLELADGTLALDALGGGYLGKDSGYLTGFTVNSSMFTDSGSRYRIVGKRVEVDIDGTYAGSDITITAVGNISPDVTLFTLPTAARPSKNKFGVGHFASATMLRVIARSDGTVQMIGSDAAVTTLPSGSTLFATISFMID